MLLIVMLFVNLICSGAQFIGTWLANKKEGPGKFVLPTGRTVEGMFKEDKMVERTDGSVLGLAQSIREVEASLVHRPKTPLGSLIGKPSKGRGDGW